jgi:hypothetical protein
MELKEYENIEEWARQEWAEVELGDKRRNERAIKVGKAMAKDPSGSIPKQMGGWGEIKAAYRLLNEEDVTHEKLSQKHWEKTKQKAGEEETVLFIQDSSEIDFTGHANTKGLGHIGNTKGKVFLMHSCLAVVPKEENPEIIGVAGQKVWIRETIYKGKEKRSERDKRETEYDVWKQTVEKIGQVAKNQRWVSVGDRASDVYSYIRIAKQLGWECLIRSSKDRAIQTQEGENTHLMKYIRRLEPEMERVIILRGREGEAKRSVVLQIVWSQLTIYPPKNGSERNQRPIEGYCIRCWENSDKEDALEWILFSTLPVIDNSFCRKK